MGQGGEMCVINATKTDWNVSTHEYQMAKWDWPSTIPAGSTQQFYFEFATEVFDDDDQADAWIQPTDQSGRTWDINSVISDGNYEVRTKCYGSNVMNNTPGVWYHIDDVENTQLGGRTCSFFIVSGDSSEYYALNPSPNWMTALLGKIGGLNLLQLCLPYSHDAGMSTITGGTAFGDAANCQTQTLSINQQLENGVRVFDLRPVITGGQYGIGHYTYVGAIDSWQGCNGQYISDIINDVNNFTSQYAELIIFDLSHAYNTDAGNSNYPDFTQDEWNSLFEQLKGVNDLYISQDPTVDLTTLTLNDFIGGGKAAVIFALGVANIDLGAYQGQGFYYGTGVDPTQHPRQWFYNGSYSDSDDPDTMKNDQINKLQDPSCHVPGQIFLTSWTLTLSSFLEVETQDILENAKDAHSEMWRYLYSSCSPSSYPNLIAVDAIDSKVTALAIAMNLNFALAAIGS